ncbi:hypothetical protein PLEOSDRAFT_1089981 [Pleurotus ostreatus PC15]|uniref:Uncharacterized protein n=1 Tax=Pleurotus ostreatus (strain PC15) TaxID=1137138 RepID=A0A067NJI1_PLEO1|nr:hypothetical protein PLEOSDRAFT_1089981 [Pleurotus ostreatus PC15]
MYPQRSYSRSRKLPLHTIISQSSQNLHSLPLLPLLLAANARTLPKATPNPLPRHHHPHSVVTRDLPPHWRGILGARKTRHTLSRNTAAADFREIDAGSKDVGVVGVLQSDGRKSGVRGLAGTSNENANANVDEHERLDAQLFFLARNWSFRWE